MATAPAPNASVLSFTGANAFTNACKRTKVYSMKPSQSPPSMAPKIIAARTQKETTWLTAQMSFPTATTRTGKPISMPMRSAWSITSPTKNTKIPRSWYPRIKSQASLSEGAGSMITTKPGISLVTSGTPSSRTSASEKCP